MLKRLIEREFEALAISLLALHPRFLRSGDESTGVLDKKDGSTGFMGEYQRIGTQVTGLPPLEMRMMTHRAGSQNAYTLVSE